MRTSRKKRAEANGRVKKVFTHEEIVLIIRGCSPKPGALITLMESKFGVKIKEKKVLHEAPNPGVLKMRAANIVRGALKRAGRFTGEVSRVPRAKAGA